MRLASSAWTIFFRWLPQKLGSPRRMHRVNFVARTKCARSLAMKSPTRSWQSTEFTIKKALTYQHLETGGHQIGLPITAFVRPLIGRVARPVYSFLQVPFLGVKPLWKGLSTPETFPQNVWKSLCIFLWDICKPLATQGDSGGCTGIQHHHLLALYYMANLKSAI